MKLKYVIIVYVVLSLVMVVAYNTYKGPWRGYADRWICWVDANEDAGIFRQYDYKIDRGVWYLRETSSPRRTYNFSHEVSPGVWEGDAFSSPEVVSFDTKDGFVFGVCGINQWFIYHKSKTKTTSNFDKTILLESEEEFKDKLAGYGIEEYDLQDPDDVFMTKTAQERWPWNYNVMRGFFGVADFNWGLIFTAIAVVMSNITGRTGDKGWGVFLAGLLCFVYLSVIFLFIWLPSFDLGLPGLFLFIISLFLCIWAYKKGVIGKIKKSNYS